jgi:hypothetical protein
MRLAFFLLVLANLIFFVWSAGYLGGQEAGREPQRLANQLNPEKIKVTPMAPAPAAPPAPAAAPAAPEGAAPAPATGPVPAAAAAPTAEAAPIKVAAVQPAAPIPAPAPACRRIDGVAAKDGGALQQAMQKAGFNVAVLPMEERSYWVNISALANKAAADKKAGELKALGVTDFHVLQGEKGSFVISLAILKDEASANQFLQAVVKKGVKSARIEARSKAAAALRLELRGPADLFEKRLPALLAAAPGASATDCP